MNHYNTIIHEYIDYISSKNNQKYLPLYTTRMTIIINYQNNCHQTINMSISHQTVTSKKKVKYRPIVVDNTILQGLNNTCKFSYRYSISDDKTHNIA